MRPLATGVALLSLLGLDRHHDRLVRHDLGVDTTRRVRDGGVWPRHVDKLAALPAELGPVDRDGGLKPQIDHNIGFQAPIGTRSACAPRRA